MNKVKSNNILRGDKKIVGGILLMELFIFVESKGVFLSEAEIGGIVGGLLFLLVAVLLAIIGIICSRKKDRSRADKYGKVQSPNICNSILDST